MPTTHDIRILIDVIVVDLTHGDLVSQVVYF